MVLGENKKFLKIVLKEMENNAGSSLHNLIAHTHTKL